jgi:hypothetical protein
MPKLATDNSAEGPNLEWSERLLAAELLWMQPFAQGLERMLWVAPHCSQDLLPDRNGMLVVAVQGSCLKGDVRASINEWPILDDSLDGLVLQHPLEAGLDLDTLIAEAVRVLRPEANLWVLTTGAASVCRFRLTSALGGVRWPSAFRAGQIPTILARSGCVDIEQYSLAFDSKASTLHKTPRALPWSSVVLVHARKRRSAHILRPRLSNGLASARLAGMPALPASRVGLAA